MVETHPSRTHCELLFQVTHAYGSSVSVTACLGCPASLSLPPWHSWSATGSQRRSSTRRGQSRRTKRKHKYSRRHSLLRLARKNCQTLFSTEILQNCSKLFNLQKCYNTSSVPLELLQWLPCLRLLRKHTNQVAFIFLEWKVIFRKNTTGARLQANLCNYL